MVKSLQAPRKSKRRKVAAQDVLGLLGQEYGPLEWFPRYDPASELVFTILSQHTSDLNAERAFNSLKDRFGDLDSMAQAPVSEVEDAIRMGGLARIKAPRIQSVLRQIKAEVGSYDLSFLKDMPLEDAKAWLKQLPGIGPKTAAVVLSFSLGMPAMPVDTHIYRVARRLGFIGPKVTADQAHDILERMVAPEEVFPFHVYLIRHGRQVCKAPRPRCGQCVLAWGCPSRDLFQNASTDGDGRPAKPGGKPKTAGP